MQYINTWLELLTQAAQATRQIDEYFFGTAEERTEDESDIRPHFYVSISFGIAVALFVYVVII